LRKPFPIVRVRPLAAAEHEGVAVGILERREGSPRLLLRRGFESDAAILKLSVGVFDVVAGEGAVEERADAVLLSYLNWLK
jgi:hypothetical protein